MEKDENFLKSKNKSKFILNIKSMELGDFSISIFKDKNTQVINIKEQIYTEKSIELNHQRLIYLGKLLQDSQTLDELKLTNNNTLHLVKSSPNENGSNNNLLQNISQNQNIILNTIRNHNNTLGEILNVLNIIENTDSNMIYRNNSDTFVQLIQTRAPFNFEKSSEVLIQNVLNIKNLINTHIQLEKNAKNNSKVKSSFLLNSAQFRVGQWVDVSDCFDVWSESQITKIEQNKALVKMTGLNNLTNINRNSRTEWIPLDSERLRPLRTKTVQNPFSMYLSPCISFNNNQIQNDNNLVFSGTNNKKDERVLYINDLVEFLDVLRPRLISFIHEKESLSAKKEKINSFKNNDYYDDYYLRHSNVKVNNLSIEEEISIRERQVFLISAVLTPLLDRIGRFMVDFSNHMFHFNFEKFKNSFGLFRENVEESISDMRNLNPNIDIFEEKVKLNLFEDLVNVPCMRIPGEVAENSAIMRPRIIIQNNIRAPIQNNRSIYEVTKYSFSLNEKSSSRKKE